MSSKAIRIVPLNNPSMSTKEVFIPLDAINAIKKFKIYGKDKICYLIETNNGSVYDVDKDTYEFVINMYTVIDLVSRREYSDFFADTKRLTKNG